MITINGMEDGRRVGRALRTCSYYTYEKAKHVYITLNIRNRRSAKTVHDFLYQAAIGLGNPFCDLESIF
jgi:hypothetical protein